jgi:phage shock protein B
MHGFPFWDTTQLIIILAFVLLAIKLFRRDRSGGRGGREAADEEARTIQELYRGFERMERRVEHLETILMDRERKEGKS